MDQPAFTNSSWPLATSFLTVAFVVLVLLQPPLLEKVHLDLVVAPRGVLQQRLHHCCDDIPYTRVGRVAPVVVLLRRQQPTDVIVRVRNDVDAPGTCSCPSSTTRTRSAQCGTGRSCSRLAERRWTPCSCLCSTPSLLAHSA